MPKSSAQNKPTPAQRSSQSARDKQLAKKRMGPNRRPRVQKKSGRLSTYGGLSSAINVNAPIAEGTIVKTTQPRFIRTAFNEQRIIHKEKVKKLVTPGAGQYSVIGAFALNPGVQQTFPWLSNEAQGWEMYRFNRLEFTWVPAIGTQAAGDIIMGPDYDAADEPPGSETAFSSYEDVQEANNWVRFSVDCNPSLLNGMTKQKYIRSSALAPNLDIKTYDSGNFFVASVDDSAANIGKLWVEYDVTLIDPQVPPGGFQASGSLIATGTLSAGHPLGTTNIQLGNIGQAVSVTTDILTGVAIGQEFSVAWAVEGTGITSLDVLPNTGCVSKTLTIADCTNSTATGATVFGTFTVTSDPVSLSYTFAGASITKSYNVISVLAPIPSF